VTRVGAAVLVSSWWAAFATGLLGVHGWPAAFVYGPLAVAGSGLVAYGAVFRAAVR
jgi:hypothetical protein